LALIATMFPLRWGPIVMTLLGITVQAGTAALLMSKRLANQIPSAAVRFTLGFFLVAHPYSDELFGNVAHGQWYLAIVSMAIVYAEPSNKLFLRAFDAVLLTMNCLTGPYAPLVAGAAWSHWKSKRTGLILALMATVTAVITVAVILNHPRTGLAKIHRFALFERMIANQVLSGPVLGLWYIQRIPMTVYFDYQMSIIAWFAVLVILLGMRKSPPFIRAIAALGAFSSLTCLITQATWFGLGNPGMGERYFYFLGLVFMFCVYIWSREAKYSVVRWWFRWLLACSAYAIFCNWVYAPPNPKWNYGPQIAKYDHLKTGEKLVIETPGSRTHPDVKWKMTLIKK
jgi:hypothetical protein